MTKFEEKYMDVLQNMEFALVQVYRQHESITDWEALNAINGLIRTYNAEQRKRQAPALKLDPLAQEAYDRVMTMCEWRLGRAEMRDEQDGPLNLGDIMTPITLSETIACLKRIRKSIQMWQKEGGRRGYFEFIDGFLP